MNLQEIVTILCLKRLTESTKTLTTNTDFGYASDLLSCVMAGATRKSIWVTLQAHGNVVAIAALLELAAVIITEGAQPDQATIDKANAEGVNLFSTNASTFEIVGRLWELGLRSPKQELV